MSEWQPIETAPTNKRFLAFRPPYPGAFDAYEVAVCKYHQSRGGKWLIYAQGHDDAWGNWTHWMPLPEPPK